MSVSATALSGKDIGGRPPSAKSRKRTLIVDLIKLVGHENLTALTQENILRAADLTIAAQEARKKISDATPASELMAILALTEAADKALGRLGLTGEPSPRLTAAVGSPVVDAISTHAAA
jgi:hypothetical protein